MGLSTRIITYAWGEKYIGELLSLALPALLAPGNLPYVATNAPCEVIILTERKFFSLFLAYPVLARIQEHCPVQLFALDDLVAQPDKYGMALTYALHRGFADLGAAATDSWLMFLNADFILADGSLRAVLGRLAAGERLVASPSYCVNSEAVTPLLLRRVDPQTQILSVPPRELASLALQHRHNTIRGKTVNRPLFSVRYIDQFYWEADGHTLLGHQMPIAIVGMRPERHLSEPNSYWDHGLMREFVPTATPYVIGDSDDFVMLELRGERVAEDQLRLGRPEPSEIARNTISFLTPYQRDMAQYPLTLHDRDLQADIAEARQQLRAYVDQVLAYTPDVLPSHLDHPQWNYHQPDFIKSRHDYLSRQLGQTTSGSEPPEGLAEVDRLWWQLDGLKKAYEQRRGELNTLRDNERLVLNTIQIQVDDSINQLDDCNKKSHQDIIAEIVSELCRVSSDGHPGLGSLEAARLFPRLGTKVGEHAGVAPWLSLIRECATLDTEARQKRRAATNLLATIREALDLEYQSQVSALDFEFGQECQQIQSKYDSLIERRVISATIPHIAIRRGPQTGRLPFRGVFGRLARQLYSSLFGGGARPKRLHPNWAPLRHLVRLVDQAARDGAADVLVVSGRGGIADTVADALPGAHARISMIEVLEGGLPAALNGVLQFDLCLCTLDAQEICQFPDLVEAVAPCMRDGSRVLGFYPNFDLLPLPVVNANLLRGLSEGPGKARVLFAGSPASARVLMRFRKTAAAAGQQRRLLTAVRIATTIVYLAPRALAANRSEDLTPEGQNAPMPDPCTSLVIEVVLRKPSPLSTRSAWTAASLVAG